MFNKNRLEEIIKKHSTSFYSAPVSDEDFKHLVAQACELEEQILLSAAVEECSDFWMDKARTLELENRRLREGGY